MLLQGKTKNLYILIGQLRATHITVCVIKMFINKLNIVVLIY